jgi:hypothetical protein
MKRRKTRQPSRESSFLVLLQTLPPNAQQDLLASLGQQSRQARKSPTHPGREKVTRVSGWHRDRDFRLVTATRERHDLWV